MDKIIYVGYYDCQENIAEKREYSPAGKTKMDYIISVLRRNHCNVQILSPSGTTTDQICSGKTIQTEHGCQLLLPKTIGGSSFWRRSINFLYRNWHLFRHLLTVPRDTPVIVYHSLGYVNLLAFLKKIRGFPLILEVEELYSDVTGDKRARRRELNLFQLADAYIFPTQMLDQSFNSAEKPSVIVHGTYHAEPCIARPFRDHKIHILYAGTLDPRKGGIIAAEAAPFLPDTYHIHILGFGSEAEVQHIKDIVSTQNLPGHATVSYDGLLSGEDYIRFVQQCSIGLSTQNPSAQFNNSSFPSKILSYMANGLHVVSVRIPPIQVSSVGDLIVYYENQTPKEIAAAILRVDLSAPYDSRTRLVQLDQTFSSELSAMLKEVKREHET